MSNYVSTTGLVLRETAYKDSSKILTVLTGTEGKLTVSARGALRKNSRLAAAAQLLVFSEMTLYSNRDRWTLTEARSIEQFQGLRGDVVLLALGSYFAELTEAAADEDSPNPELMPLCLNALFALSEGLKTPGEVKPAFELRLMATAGLAPQLMRCAVCGKAMQDGVEQSDAARYGAVQDGAERDYAYLDLSGGSVKCREHAVPNSAALSHSAVNAANYIISCNPKKLLSFELGETALKELCEASEQYLLTQFDRKFRTLDYYRKL